jgi:acetyl/propionyl-CoA carboxylase alpha subunit
VPGVDGLGKSDDELAAAAAAIGYPVLIKASAGGGGKGMRVVHEAGQLRDALQAARQEAQSAFGDPHVLLEKYFTEIHHVEVQVLGDLHGNLLHLYERECSVQRRHQKIIEESPAPIIGGNAARCARPSPPRPCAWPRPPATATPGRWSSSSTARAASTSWR